MEKKLYEMQAELCKTPSESQTTGDSGYLERARRNLGQPLAEILEIPKAGTHRTIWPC